jgi:hypothetical protein
VFSPQKHRVALTQSASSTSPAARPSHSVTNAARPLGHEVVTLDSILPADIQCDLHQWDHTCTAFPTGHFDLIAASPPCAVWSNARMMNLDKLRLSTGRPWTRVELDADSAGPQGAQLVDWLRQVLDTFNPSGTGYFQPKWLAVQNARLHHGPAIRVRGLLPVRDWGYRYRKRTGLWTNIPLAPRTCDGNPINRGGYLHEKHRMPSQLIGELLGAVITSRHGWGVDDTNGAERGGETSGPRERAPPPAPPPGGDPPPPPPPRHQAEGKLTAGSLVEQIACTQSQTSLAAYRKFSATSLLLLVLFEMLGSVLTRGQRRVLAAANLVTPLLKLLAVALHLLVLVRAER